jgi:ABC-type polysaccharide/polyol phosphate export permease
MTTNTVYDSDQARRPLISEAVNLWTNRQLVRALVNRDLTIRYKRSILGMWWTLLYPLLTTLVLWVVFGQFFRFETPGVPYIVYLLSGILFITFFTQAVVASASAIVNNAPILTKVYVPPEVFSFSSAIAAAANFLISLVALFFIQIITGVGIPWTVFLVVIPIAALLAMTAGLGLLVASAAVVFYDVLDLTAVLLQIVAYLTPTFYPISIVPERFTWVIEANPIHSYLLVFRGFVYEGAFAPGWAFAYMIGSAILVLLLGVWTFSKSWRRLVVVL